MADFKRFYMTVTIDRQPEGINITCWMSAEDTWLLETAAYPFTYTSMGEFCTWIMHSNVEMTLRLIGVVREEADAICIRQEKINSLRKLANR